MEVVIQEEPTGCGIASVANIVGLSYADVKHRANSIGIFSEDKTLYSDTGYVRKLLQEFGFQAASSEMPFESWSQLPDLALLATKYHLEAEKPYWHWAVYKRENPPCVLDSSTSLTKNKIIDLSDINPKWYISVSKK